MKILMTIAEAKNAIITFNTLPPQIDYTEPFRRKALEAEAFIDTLPEDQQMEILDYCQAKTEEYYAPGMDGSPSAAHFDSLF